MTMTFDEVKNCIKQRFPILMLDRVLEVDLGRRIKAVKNVTHNEIQFLGHFADLAILPGPFIIESIGQCASILFRLTEKTYSCEHEFLVLAAINEMQFLAPVVPGHTMVVEVFISKMIPTMALVEGTVTVDGTLVAKGKLSFAKKVM